MPDAAILANAAFAGLAAPGRFGAETAAPGVTLRETTQVALASVIARKGQAAALALAAQRAFFLDLPVAPRRAGTPHLAFTSAGPGQWLASDSGGDSDALASRLTAAFSGLAAVAAHGDGRAVLRIAGPRARDTLAKGLPLDLHERAFKPGDTAMSVIAHMGVHITQLDAAPSYEIILPRSFAASFWHWLTAAAGEFGYETEAPLAPEVQG